MTIEATTFKQKYLVVCDNRGDNILALMDITAVLYECDTSFSVTTCL